MKSDRKNSSKHLAEVGKQILMSPRTHMSPKAFNALSSSVGSPETSKRKTGQVKESSHATNVYDEDSEDSYEDDDFDDDEDDEDGKGYNNSSQKYKDDEEAPRLTCLADQRSESLLESVSPKVSFMVFMFHSK